MNTESQRLKIQRHLYQGKHITPIGALAKWDCMRLGARIYELRKLKFPIKTTLVRDGKKVFASYSIQTRGKA